MKSYKIVLALALAATMLFGCGKKKGIEQEPVETVEDDMPEDEEEIIAAEAPDLEQIPEGSVKSYLTGEHVPEEIGKRRPVAVMLNNIKEAVPQTGIEKAGVIYEAPVEGGITRLMGIFEDYDGMEKIGSVRSCRTYYIYFAMEFNAIYMHFGQAVYAVELLNDPAVNNISGLSLQEGAGKIDGYAGEDVFYRTSDRKAPHNVYTNAKSIETAVERKGYSKEYQADYTGHYQFAKAGDTIDLTNGTAATHITPNYEINEPWFEYDAATQMYKRFQYGAKQIDQLTNEQLSYKNIIMQYCKWENYDKNGYLNIDCTTGGAGKYITNGKAIDITWKKDTKWGPTRYYDSNGQEITLNTGKTWVCIIQDTKSGDVEIKGDTDTQSESGSEEADESTGTETSNGTGDGTNTDTSDE